MKYRKNNLLNIIFLLVTYAVLIVPFKLYFRIKIIEVNKLISKSDKDSRPVIIIFNHASHLDVFVMGLYVGFPLLFKATFPAKKEIFDHRLTRWLMPIMGVIPVNRRVADISAARSILGVLKDGNIIIMAPEGVRGFTDEIQPLKTGFLKLAHKANALILPIGIHGAAAAWPRNTNFPRPRKITLHVGAPIEIRDYVCAEGKKNDYKVIAESIRQKMTALIAVCICF